MSKVNTFVEKIAVLRETESLNRVEFCKLLDVSTSTMTKIERLERKPNLEIIQKVCNAFPEYTLWLMTNQTTPETGQISPVDKRSYRASSDGNNNNYNYENNSVAVHNNHGSIDVRDDGKKHGGRGARLVGFINDWMDTHDEDDRVWLEKQIERAVPEFKKWKVNKG